MSSQLLMFPKGFLWGAATSSYQVEGAVADDGRGPSIWDTFDHQPGKVLNGDTGEVACDHYHRWEGDLDLLNDLGLRSYRFSVSWPRVQPDGAGKVNQKGLDFYRRLVEGLRHRGIEPLLTLYHWDLPEALQQKGGWTSRETTDRFEEFAGIMGSAFHDGVTLWVTLNEPFFAAFEGYELGGLAPGLTDTGAAVEAAHNMLLAHGKAVRTLRACLPESAEIGIALNLDVVRPATSSPEDVAAAGRVNDYLNRWFLDAVLKGSYPRWLHDRYVQVTGREFVRAGDLGVIGAGIDFLGVNYYTPVYVESEASRDRMAPGSRSTATDTVLRRPYPDYLAAAAARRPAGNYTAKGWDVDPGGLREMLLWLRHNYNGVPVYITENGASYPDAVGADGEVHDPRRIEYLRTHLVAANEAIVEGVDLRGYFVWSLLDNFEWGDGYAQRFGIIHVDFATQRRTPKSSAKFLSEVARRNAVSRAAASLPADT